jgi:hypothetical protein
MHFGEIMRSLISYCLIIAFCVACGAAKNGGREGNENPGKKPENSRSDLTDKLINAAFQKSAFSNVYRTKGYIRLTYVELAKKMRENTDLGYTALIPNIDIHNTIIIADHKPEIISDKIIECGNSIDRDDSTEDDASVTDRISNCKNTDFMVLKAVFWSGKELGRNGEGNWELVAFSKSENIKLWKDTRTGLVWSDIVVEDADFKTASGVKIDEEENKDNRICQVPNNLTSPHALGRISNKKIHWRLPNRNEYLQADLNGARNVLSKTSELTWTSTHAGDSNEAWAITQSTGVLVKLPTDTKIRVRCIGIPL